MWDTNTGKQIRVLPKTQDQSVAWSLDGQRIATFGTDVIIWNVATGQRQHTLRVQALNVAWNRASTRVAVTETQQTSVWDVTTGQRLYLLPTQSYLSWSSDDRQILGISPGGVITLWDSASGKTLLTLRDDTTAIETTWRPDGKAVLATCSDGTVRQYLVRLDDVLALARTRVTRQLTPEERAQFGLQ